MRRFALPLLLLGMLTLPVAADPDPNILYTSRKEFVRVSPPHQLTLNAKINQFAYDPLGLEVACNGAEVQGDQKTYFVKTLDVRTGKELHRLTLTVPQGIEAGFRILGWTPSGRHLLVERTQPKDDGSGDSVTDLVRWDLSADPPRVRPVAEDFPVPEGRQLNSISRFASPQGRRVLLEGILVVGSISHSTYLVYDAEQDTSQPLPRPQDAEIYDFWQDDSHLLVRSGPKREQQQMDVITGKISSLKDQPGADDPAASKQFPDLSLIVDHKTQVDSSRSGAMASTLIWVRCDLRQRQPLSTVGAGIMMSADDPQAVWSPTGKQIAYLNHGDLYVSDVALMPPGKGLPDEKMALGLPLTCPEERTIASSDMKQIGLGMIQYTQDYDETYPTADDIDEKLLPYIKKRSVFSVGTVHWAYQMPPGHTMASIDAPADTMLGTMTLPCGQVTLYADGNVKIVEKE